MKMNVSGQNSSFGVKSGIIFAYDAPYFDKVMKWRRIRYHLYFVLFWRRIRYQNLLKYSFYWLFEKMARKKVSFSLIRLKIDRINHSEALKMAKKVVSFLMKWVVRRENSDSGEKNGIIFAVKGLHFDDRKKWRRKRYHSDISGNDWPGWIIFSIILTEKVK